jgi:hypothetical protein
MFQAATIVKWQGQFYKVTSSVEGDQITVVTEPQNDELGDAARENIMRDPLKRLSVYIGFGENSLTNDPRHGT